MGKMSVEWEQDGKMHRFVNWDTLKEYRFPSLDTVKPTPEELKANMRKRETVRYVYRQ